VSVGVVVGVVLDGLFATQSRWELNRLRLFGRPRGTRGSVEIRRRYQSMRLLVSRGSIENVSIDEAFGQSGLNRECINRREAFEWRRGSRGSVEIS
jgi:hypothetical protein